MCGSFSSARCGRKGFLLASPCRGREKSFSFFSRPSFPSCNPIVIVHTDTHTHADERLGREKYRPLENNSGISAAQQQQRRPIEIESLKSRSKQLRSRHVWSVEGLGRHGQDTGVSSSNYYILKTHLLLLLLFPQRGWMRLPTFSPLPLPEYI